MVRVMMMMVMMMMMMMMAMAVAMAMAMTTAYIRGFAVDPSCFSRDDVRHDGLFTRYNNVPPMRSVAAPCAGAECPGGAVWRRPQRSGVVG